MNKLRKTISDIEKTVEAASFAEEGELETARGILRAEHSPSEQLKKLKHDVEALFIEIDTLSSKAIASSEAGEFEKAKEIMAEVNTKLENVKKIHKEIFDSLNYAPRIIPEKDKRHSDSEGQKKYHYNYYKYKESLSKAGS
ncbi:MAG: hypothetical protein AB1632_14095 [Nitrospirota bacterium]